MVDMALRDGLQELLEKRWWVMALRGAVAIVFGIICFANPAAAGLSLLIVFGAFALVDGLLGLVASVGKARRGERWVWLAVEAVANIVIGLLIFFQPALSAVVLFLIIAIKAAVSGVLMLLAATKLDGAHGRGFLVAAGVISLAFAALLFLSPMVGLKILIWWIGLWAVLAGVALLALGFKLRGFARKL